MLSYNVIYYEKFRKVMQRTKKIDLLSNDNALFKICIVCSYFYLNVRHAFLLLVFDARILFSHNPFLRGDGQDNVCMMSENVLLHIILNASIHVILTDFVVFKDI